VLAGGGGPADALAPERPAFLLWGVVRHPGIVPGYGSRSATRTDVADVGVRIGATTAVMRRLPS
jgi:hypothetical protein